MDPRQGPFDKYSYCQTCAGGVTENPGDFVHINLARPVYHIVIKEKIIKMIGGWNNEIGLLVKYIWRQAILI